VDIGKLFMIAGILLLVIGFVLKFAPWIINWFGRLPGDIHFKSEHSTVFIPITSMIIISLILSLLLNFLFRK
jgi:DUF2905 family protein